MWLEIINFCQDHVAVLVYKLSDERQLHILGMLSIKDVFEASSSACLVTGIFYCVVA